MSDNEYTTISPPSDTLPPPPDGWLRSRKGTLYRKPNPPRGIEAMGAANRAAARSLLQTTKTEDQERRRRADVLALVDPSRPIYARALAADRALNAALKLGDLPDAEVLAADDLLQDAYETLPTSPAEVADLADLGLATEDLDDAMRALLTSIRDGARRLMK